MIAPRSGPRNHILDIAGLSIGHAEDERVKSGSTVLLFDEPTIASLAVLGGAPGTRETDLLAPENTVAGVDALVLSGGSAFGLEAASGVMARLAETGRGFAVAGARVPIVPAAILFDLANGGAKDWGATPPYRELGYRAASQAGDDTRLGRVGAGFGARTACGIGGLGSASMVLENGVTVAALVAVNAVGSPLMGDGPHFWAAPFEIGTEFGGFGLPSQLTPDLASPRTKFDAAPGANTTIGIVATDAVLDKGAAKRLAIAGHAGLAKAIFPSHTDFDGDLVFAAATGRSRVAFDPRDRASVLLGAAAASTMARAVARGVFAARRTG
ncbi:L-aminopeptidase/D-esterase [Fulvimarina manganoxydans]|uniref:L-aminopeptidase/D-esterase n=1 Tax=Fulvimarina manganoxydans TaxID=937218 RepID=A0A1W2AZ94_9HYPH|nr:P1 family peptidase [Fulvimarina manganoxydans]SMC66035.1 L-aminopeptidase/D-esterase [Fulvimarina manganoxydans]